MIINALETKDGGIRTVNDVALLLRPLEAAEHEQDPAKEVWGDKYHELRTNLGGNSLVIGRFSCLPHYWEIEKEVENLNGKLINSKRVHEEITEMKWTRRVDNTPKTWFHEGWATVPETEHGWVVKGKVNSRKFQWGDMMFAEDRDQLEEVMRNLRMDARINSQGLVIREYVPLEKIDEGINEMPITNEWRFFFLNSGKDHQEVGSGFYWDITEKADDMTEVPKQAREAAKEANRKFHRKNSIDLSFVTVDVAKTKEGDWIVIEFNDGQQSGLSTIDPHEFHENLKSRVGSIVNFDLK